MLLWINLRTEERDTYVATKRTYKTNKPCEYNNMRRWDGDIVFVCQIMCRMRCEPAAVFLWVRET